MAWSPPGPTSCSPSAASSALPRFAGPRSALLLQRLGEFALGHRRPAADAELAGPLVQMPLAGVDVHSTGGRPLPLPRPAFGLLVGGPAALLRHPAVTDLLVVVLQRRVRDRKSTRLNSSHVKISYAVF